MRFNVNYDQQWEKCHIPSPLSVSKFFIWNLNPNYLSFLAYLTQTAHMQSRWTAYLQFPKHPKVPSSALCLCSDNFLLLDTSHPSPSVKVPLLHQDTGGERDFSIKFSLNPSFVLSVWAWKSVIEHITFHNGLFGLSCSRIFELLRSGIRMIGCQSWLCLFLTVWPYMFLNLSVLQFSHW